MAKQSAFAFTNTTASTHDITPIALGVVTNYAVTEDTANQAVLSNKTAPIDAQEIISYRSRKLQQVNNNLNIVNPSPVKGGMEYSVQVEETLVTTDTSDATFRVDEPIVYTIGIRHGKSGNISASIVAEGFVRALSALRRADGSWRFDDMMRSAERPIVD